MRKALILAVFAFWPGLCAAASNGPEMAISLKKGFSMKPMMESPARSYSADDLDVFFYDIKTKNRYWGMGVRKREDSEKTKYLALPVIRGALEDIGAATKESLTDSGWRIGYGLGPNFVSGSGSKLYFYGEVVVGLDIVLWKWQRGERSFAFNCDVKFEALKNFDLMSLTPMIGFTYQLF